MTRGVSLNGTQFVADRKVWGCDPRESEGNPLSSGVNVNTVVSHRKPSRDMCCWDISFLRDLINNLTHICWTLCCDLCQELFSFQVLFPSHTETFTEGVNVANRKTLNLFIWVTYLLALSHSLLPACVTLLKRIWLLNWYWKKGKIRIENQWHYLCKGRCCCSSSSDFQ